MTPIFFGIEKGTPRLRLKVGKVICRVFEFLLASHIEE
jgi:hypothetical protein